MDLVVPKDGNYTLHINLEIVVYLLVETMHEALCSSKTLQSQPNNCDDFEVVVTSSHR